MRLRLVAALFVLSLGACRTESRKAATPGQSGDTEAQVAGQAEGSGIEAAVEGSTAVDCGQDGRVWEGRLDGCLYEHGGCCYDNPDAACRAANCPSERCRILESSPAQLYCA